MTAETLIDIALLLVFFVLVTGSCPCQPFSQAGKGAAFDDPRHLLPVGLPPEWDVCAVTAMQSLRRKRKRS